MTITLEVEKLTVDELITCLDKLDTRKGILIEDYNGRKYSFSPIYVKD